jgi:hypothetical protein
MRLDLLEGVRTLQWSGLHPSHPSGITDTLNVICRLETPLATADGTWPFVSPVPSGRFTASGPRGIGSADGVATCSGECEGPR